MDVLGLILSMYSGLYLGSLYALMAMGLALIWSTLRIANFAHGAILTLGAYIMWSLITQVGLNYVLAFVLTVLAVALVGAIIERGVFHLLRYGSLPALATLMSTIAIAIVIQQMVQILFGPRLKIVPTIARGFEHIGPFVIDNSLLAISMVAIGCFASAYLFLKKTKVGLGIRAVAQDMDAGKLMGINVDRLYLLTMALGGATAAVTGILLGSIIYVTPDLGSDPLFIGFIVCVFGGVNSIKGTIIAAYIVGLVESIAIFVVGSFWSLPILFIMMMIVLVVKPFGLFGLEEVTAR